jgi:hypothetical protein
MGTGYFPGVKWPERGVDHSPHLAPRLKNRATHLLTQWAFMARPRVTFTYLVRQRKIRMKENAPVTELPIIFCLLFMLT